MEAGGDGFSREVGRVDGVWRRDENEGVGAQHGDQMKERA